MRKIFSILILSLSITTGFGQNELTEKADKLYDGYQYVDAIEAYLELVNDRKANGYVYKQLGDSYYNIYNTKEASKWYAKAVKSQQDAETYYRYAQILKSEGNYEASKKQMDRFSELKPDDQRAKAYLANPDYVPQLADKDKSFTVEKCKISDSKESDFGAVLSNDNILYFVSTRKETSKEDKGTKTPYLDIFSSKRNDNGSLSRPQEVKELNTAYHDGPITISSDGKTMYFSRDGHSEKSYKKIKKNSVKLAQQGIYKATLVNGRWENIEALPINSTEYTVTHPSISHDGKTLYFASNMPGGIGDTDIWKISVNGNSYGQPENMGPKVNSAGKEGFPFSSKNNILYFSSNGKQGYGGLDVFKLDLNADNEAENLGNGINTNHDDFSFSMNDTKKVGYFSSNRDGADNLFIANPICKLDITTLVTDSKTNNIIPGAEIILSDAQNNKIATQSSDDKGQTAFQVGCEVDYFITVSKAGYNSISVPVSASQKTEISVSAALSPLDEIITETEVKLNNIYFEFNKSNITPQGALELDKLVSIMNTHATMEILVRSHTDTQGSQDYNLKLSERRAQATMQYLISKGISKDRLTAKGMGSSEPKIDCKSNCTEEEDAKNRRSEFLIVKK
ncbi:OmpA family protein [Mangrovimonas sp. ST2L15]|uniref:OmpA family protein n=1 Tax=Mangrovimonas sp. ST2L15 TaxID=1645916 RepID=UPI0006B49202|nr:OmpA family protein [Mangrovimonas sp. ST2L15]